MEVEGSGSMGLTEYRRNVLCQHPAQHPVRGVREVFPTFAYKKMRKIIHIAGSTFYFPNIPTSRVGHRVFNQNHAMWTRTAFPTGRRAVLLGDAQQAIEGLKTFGELT